MYVCIFNIRELNFFFWGMIVIFERKKRLLCFYMDGLRLVKVELEVFLRIGKNSVDYMCWD